VKSSRSQLISAVRVTTGRSSDVRKTESRCYRLAFDHEVHDVEVPLTGDRMAMRTLLVSANDK
jgi:hypothetical protein